MLLQFLLLVGAAAGVFVAWAGWDKANGLKMLAGAASALVLFGASCSLAPKDQFTESCRSYGRFASDC